jgi:hypothetical protein
MLCEKGPSAGSYVYDGNFKRVKQVVNGKTIYSVYSRAGELLQRDNTTDGKRVSYLVVGGQQIAEVTTAGIATYFHNNQLGSPVAPPTRREQCSGARSGTKISADELRRMRWLLPT